MKDATLHSMWAPYGISYCKMSKCQMGLNWNAIGQHSYECYEHCTSMKMPLLQWDTCDVFFLTMEVEDECGPPQPLLQQKVHHTLIGKLPKPKVTLFHARTLFPFRISKMQNCIWLAW